MSSTLPSGSAFSRWNGKTSERERNTHDFERERESERIEEKKRERERDSKQKERLEKMSKTTSQKSDSFQCIFTKN